MSYVCNLYSHFSELLAATPVAPALKYANGDIVSRAALAAEAEHLAVWLVAAGVQRGDVIGIVHTKAPSCFALMLACLRLGLPYVNLDPENPGERLGLVLDVCVPRFVFNQQPVVSEFSETCRSRGIPVIDIGDILRTHCSETLSAENAVIGTDLAYLMFTSGSTGIPKGVAISHQQVLNLVDWAKDEFAIGEHDVLTSVNPMYFDNSVFDFYASLFNGAGLAVVPRETVDDPQMLVAAVEDMACTLWFSVPSLLIYLTTTRVLTPNSLRGLKCIAFGGEGYPLPELRKLFTLFGSRARLVNVYGPTECTCICSAHTVTHEELVSPDGLPPIGRLAKNFRGVLLDGDAEASLGEVGELCLIGPNVGLGYYRDAERTAKVFVPNPLCQSHDERMYRTGDLLRVDLETGLLHFVGRKDNQIKHMGYRIEPEEVEAALQRIHGVGQAVVVYRRERSSFGYLIAFVSMHEAPVDGTEYLRNALAQYLPPYMLPREFRLRNEWPKNANGKVDRKKLSEEP